MKVVRYSTFDELAPLAGEWDQLSGGVPFRGWTWMSAWWRHYGLSPLGRRRRMSLFVLVVLGPSGEPVGIAPWYRRVSVARGRVLQFLGVEEVCGDYMSILCQPGFEEPVAAALADWLTDVVQGAPRHDVDRDADADRDANPDCNAGWDLLEMTGVDAEDTAVRCLAARLAQRKNSVHERAGPNCWRIELPSTWDEYLARLSKSHRKQIRRIQRNLLETGQVVVHEVRQLEDLERAERVLVDLHQRRWESVGQPGCFASAPFAAFHHDIMPKLLADGMLRLSWAELDGRPLLAEYHLGACDVVYAYQAGVDPDALQYSPGRLGNLIGIRQAIQDDCRAFDFLRGDEPYKEHWRATVRPSIEFRIAAARPTARLRQGLWLAGSNVKHWLQNSSRAS